MSSLRSASAALLGAAGSGEALVRGLAPHGATNRPGRILSTEGQSRLMTCSLRWARCAHLRNFGRIMAKTHSLRQSRRIRSLGIQWNSVMALIAARNRRRNIFGRRMDGDLGSFHRTEEPLTMEENSH